MVAEAGDVLDSFVEPAGASRRLKTYILAAQ